MSFGSALLAARAAYGPLCVGIDPHEHLLTAWGLPVDAEGVRAFGLRVVEAAAGRVGVVKPQVAFFERFGSAGFAALEEVMAAARAAGLLVIADAKRGDIGTTMDGYAAAWLAPGAPLEADAVTVSPYLGAGALEATFTLAHRHGKGVFVLAATSNPEGRVLQRAVPHAGEGHAVSVAGEVVAAVSDWTRVHEPDAELGSIGFVIGATVERTALGLPERLVPAAPILAPGFGAQGAEPRDLIRLFGPDAPGVVASESRSILSAGPAPEALAARIAERRSLYSEAQHG
ncbi:orotidine-5'-phosphate decarboxylase [Microbacterium sp. GXF7504]